MPDAAGHTIASDWPNPPPNAEYHTPHLLQWSGYGYTVAGAPPYPFPLGVDAGPWPVETYGPPGTLWIFSSGDIFENWTHVPAPFGRVALRRLLRKLGSYSIGSSLWAWRTPDPEGVQPPMSIKVIRTTIHAKFGASEEMAHVLHWRSSPTPDVDQDMAAIKTFADQVRDHWVAFLNASGPAGSGSTIKSHISSDVKYDEVRAAFLEITPGVRPRYLVPTQYSTFAGTTGNCTGGPPLPYEVALCLSLNTHLRGARYRGRTYLGGLTVSELGSNGLFLSTNTLAFGLGYWQQMVQAMTTDTGNDLHVLSAKYGESWPVSGVRVGVVPDSQRRRRRKQLEAYALAGGTAAGV